MKVDPPVSKKPRLSKEETSQKLIDTTIAMMHTTSLSEISSLKICAAAGLDKMTVRYCFGSHAQLLIAVARHLGPGTSAHVINGIFSNSARSDKNAQLFGRLMTFIFASYGGELPLNLSPSRAILVEQKNVSADEFKRMAEEEMKGMPAMQRKVGKGG